jgi:glycosyltransferase involved in cell wall biosynthesis
MARVTVVIPTYDRPEFLEQAIRSVLAQTFPDFELIVSDDGTNPRTREVVERLDDDRIRYRRTAGRLGIPRHFNDCAKHAGSELFGLLPDDDVYTPTYLERMVAALDANPGAGFAQCGFYAVDRGLRCIEEMVAASASFHAAGDDALIWQLPRLLCNPAAVLYRHDAMVSVGLWREDYHFDDWAFVVRVAYRRGFVFVPEALACVRRHEENLSIRMMATPPGVDHVIRMLNQQADVFGEARQLSGPLLALRSRLSRECGHRLLIAALRCAAVGDWQTARLAVRLARSVHPMSVADPRVAVFGIRNLLARRRLSALQRAAQSKAPVLQV